MPLYSLRETDPKGELSAFPQEEPSTANQLLNVLSNVMSTLQKGKEAKQKRKLDEYFRTAAAKELDAGRAQGEYDYDPDTGKFKAKIKPKEEKDLSAKVNAAINRYKTMQQFSLSEH